MCGISINSDQNKHKTISHRGLPNEDSIIYYEPLKVSLYHTRLPLQTTSGDIWSQPIPIGKNKYLLYNGEIFNYDKTLYENDVHYLKEFFTEYNSYEKIIYQAIKEIQNWDGFWSICIVTPEGIIAFTDPLGKKQLYYDTLHLNIASELKPLIKGDLDYGLFSTILKWGYNTDDRTPWVQIKRILPNKIYFIQPNIKSIQIFSDYFKFNNIDEKNNNLKKLLYESVESRMISKHYPVGMLLSGGLDSTIITSIIEKLGINVNYYSIENGESEYVKEVQDYYNIDVKYLDYPNINNITEEVLKYNDFPIDMGSLFMQHSILSIVPEKIVMTGDGADELFGGYKRIHNYDSQLSDVFEELPYYHLPRLDRASMRYTIELRNPFLSHNIVKFALNCVDKPNRTDKKILKDLFRSDIPKSILNRPKLPLKSKNIIKNQLEERKRLIESFIVTNRKENN